MPERMSASDDLPHRMSTWHVAGFFRAIGSALDCLGASVVGVLALPTSLLRADLGTATRALDSNKNPATDGERMQAEFAVRFADWWPTLDPRVGSTGPWTTATCWSTAAVDFSSRSCVLEEAKVGPSSSRERSNSSPRTPASPTLKFS